MSILSNTEKSVIISCIENCTLRNLEYALYGTGKITNEILQMLFLLGLKHPKAILDHAASQKCISGIQVFSPNAETLGGIGTIILCSNIYADEMQKHLVDIPPQDCEIFRFDHLRKQEQILSHRQRSIENGRISKIIYGISSFAKTYALHAESEKISGILDLLALHKIPLPSLILSDKTEGEEQKIPIKRLENINGNSGIEVILSFAGAEAKPMLAKYFPRADIVFAHSEMAWRKFGLDFYKLFKIPFIQNMSLVLEPSCRCNLCCKYCYTPQQRKTLNKQPDMSFELASEMLEALDGHINHLEIGGTGEPLLYGQLDDLMKKASQEHSLYITITSNGTLLNKEKSLSLARQGLNLFNLSLDTISEKYNKSIRGINTEKIIQNASDFSVSTGIPININSVLTADSLELVETLPSLKKRIPSLRSIYFVTPRHFNKASDFEISLSDELLRECVENLTFACSKHNIICNFSNSNIYARHRLGGCARLWDNISITNSGEMRTCCFFHYVDNDCNLIAKNVRGDNILEYLNSGKYQDLRKNSLLGIPPMSICEGCPFAESHV